MKVLHLATDDNFGGAARAAYRQHLALRASGINSRMLVRYKHTVDPEVQIFSGDSDFTSRARRFLMKSWLRYLHRNSYIHSQALVRGLVDPRADLYRTSDQHIAEADIINIHQVDNFVDIPSLFSTIPTEKPIVVTLHNLAPFTGGCYYSCSCSRFKDACGCCPAAGSTHKKDYSRRIFKMKLAAYRARIPRRLAFVADSRWIAQMACASSLLKGFRIETIHYGVDSNVYNSDQREIARNSLGIAPNELIVFFGAHDLYWRHKGVQELQMALSQLKFGSSVRIFTMGSGNFDFSQQCRHIHFGHIESDLLQSLLYRSADVFIIPSLEEAFGQTALEAVACGTVVAGFSTGGVGDIVQNGLNGLLVERGNSSALAGAIDQLLKDSTLRESWRRQCKDWVEEHFSFAKNAAAYIALYESLLNA